MPFSAVKSFAQVNSNGFLQ